MISSHLHLNGLALNILSRKIAEYVISILVPKVFLLNNVFILMNQLLAGVIKKYTLKKIKRER